MKHERKTKLILAEKRERGGNGRECKRRKQGVKRKVHETKNEVKEWGEKYFKKNKENKTFSQKETNIVRR